MSKVEVDPRGWPDYTYPMTIIGQELNVAIDIAAQSIPTLDINIASSAVTLNINIESISEGVVFNVAQSGDWTINAVQTGTWTINIGGPLDASGNIKTSIMDSVQLDVNIAASAVTLNVNIAESAVTLNVNIESISEGVTFNVAQSGTWTINAVQTGDWNINIESVSAGVTFNVNITGSTATLDVKITSSDAILSVLIIGQTASLDIRITDSTVTLNVNIESIASGVVFNVAQSGTWTINAVQTGDWSINIESVSAGVTFNVNITGSTVTLDVNITGSTATLDVNIASSSVAINIKTETGANIVIDKLTESAYTEERRIIANNGTSPTAHFPYSVLVGKYFPRGCRGFINKIEISCANYDTADRKLYIYVSIQPGMAPIITAELTVPASTSRAWRAVTINRFWNYDSMFIYVKAETSSAPQVYYDTEEKYDAMHSSDNGVTWTPQDRRYWFRVDMTGQTVGDLPITGTLNTIEVPGASSVIESETTLINPGETKTLISVEGSGKVEGLMFKMWISTGNPHPGNCKLHFIIDGEDNSFIFAHLADIFEYRTDTISPFSLTVYDDASGNWGFALNKPIEFKLSFQLKVESTAAPDNTFHAKAYALITLIN